MTVCNMSIEAGARAGMIAPDETTFAYLEGRRDAPKGADWEAALDDWRACHRRRRDVSTPRSTRRGRAPPQVTWGTNPGAGRPDRRRRARARRHRDAGRTRGRRAGARNTWASSRGRRSPTSRRHRLHRLLHQLAGSRTSAPPPRCSAAGGSRAGVRALVVPGSSAVKRQAEAEGLDGVFIAAGFEWREPGCSMCLGMNPDQLAPGERCASTSNRNFEGRQGGAAAPTSSRPRWPRRPRSPAASPPPPTWG